MWADDRDTWDFLSYDPKTDKFRDYPRPDGMQRVGGTVAVDSKGNPWAETENGAIKLDVATGKYTYYKALHEGINYGVTVDAEDKAWVAYPGIDTLQVVDKDGHVSEVVLPPLNPSFGNDRDRDLVKTTKMYQNNSGPLQKGPRRLAADTRGNYVWVAEFFADQIARIDIHTKEVKEYHMPERWSQPYAVNVDKNHNVWINMMDQDRVAKFDPSTEKFTEYQMPTRGTEIRHILADNSTDPPAIWAPYDRVNKIARIQFRKSSDIP